MLESFEITNFRLFQHLQVKKLSRVNLIIGKNNAGKSSFLEAVELYVSNASPVVLLDLLKYRQESWYSEDRWHSQGRAESLFRHLFFGRKFPKLTEVGISLGEINSIQIRIQIAAYQVINDYETGELTRSRHSELSIDEYTSDFEVYLISEENGKTKRIFSIDSARDNKPTRTLLIIEPKFKYLWQSVSTKNMADQKLSNLWDLTSLNTESKAEVINALCLIDKNVTGVGFVDDDSKERDRIPLVTMLGIDEPLPLKSMGDGMTRLFHIILALVNAKNGILLIDEFENGLHWSVQPKVWNVIFQVAEKLNVQVFATTHSRDCIAGFDEAWNTYPELGAFLRLDIKDGTVKATEYTSETLNDSLEMDVEVR